MSLRARQWFNSNFKNPKDVLQTSDMENGEVFGNGSFRYSAILKAYGTSQVTTGFIIVKISIWAKDNKYKYEIGPFSIETMQSSSGISNNNSLVITKSENHPSVNLIKMNTKMKEGLNAWWNEIKRQCEVQALLLIESLQKSMLVKYKGDW